QVLLFENVPGLQSKMDGRLFRSFFRSLCHLGYSLTSGILNAANYGVPQRRRRLFLLGSMEGRIELPSVTHGSPRNEFSLPAYVTIADTLSRLTFDMPNQRVPDTTQERRLLIERIVPGSEWRHWRHRDRWEEP